MTITPLSPSKAKLAAQIIKSQQGEIDTFKEKVGQLEADLSELNRYKECIKIAHQISEKGIISKDFDSIMDKAAALAESGKDLSVVKEALDMAQSNFDLGSPDSTKPGSGGRMDAITETLISLA